MQQIRLHFPQRKSIDAPAPNWSISCGDLTMTVDTDYLPAQLYRLLPNGGYAVVDPEEFRPFCNTAIAFGLMK